MLATIKFRPLERETLQLLVDVNKQEGNPIATYSRLMSADMVAAAVLELSPEQVAQHAEAFSAQAARAVVERPDIFGQASAP